MGKRQLIIGMVHGRDFFLRDDCKVTVRTGPHEKKETPGPVQPYCHVEVVSLAIVLSEGGSKD